MERIGDECCKIARFLKNSEVEPENAIWKELRPATRLAKNLLSRTIDILARNDTEAAYILIKDDEELDVQYHNAIRVISSYMIEDTNKITQGIDVLMAAKALERIGDHCINIAESTIFATEAKTFANTQSVTFAPRAGRMPRLSRATKAVAHFLIHIQIDKNVPTAYHQPQPRCLRLRLS